MKICVLIKQVPDKDSKITITADSKSIEKTNITNIINESDNYALEEALLLKEKQGGEVVVCTFGGESSNEIILLVFTSEIPSLLYGSFKLSS